MSSTAPARDPRLRSPLARAVVPVGAGLVVLVRDDHPVEHTHHRGNVEEVEDEWLVVAEDIAAGNLVKKRVGYLSSGPCDNHMEGVGDAASNEDIVEGAEHVGGGRLVGVVVPDAVDDVLVLVDAG